MYWGGGVIKRVRISVHVNLQVQSVTLCGSLSKLEGLLHGVPPVPTSVTTSIMYSVPAVKPDSVKWSEVFLDPTVARTKVGLESGEILMTEKRSKFELEGVEIPLPLMMMEFKVEALSATIGISGSEKFLS